MSHTSGTWYRTNVTIWAKPLMQEKRAICTLQLKDHPFSPGSKVTEEEMLANAALIQEAPQLLQLMRAALMTIQQKRATGHFSTVMGEEEDTDNLIEAMQNAINKASNKTEN